MPGLTGDFLSQDSGGPALGMLTQWVGKEQLFKVFPFYSNMQPELRVNEEAKLLSVDAWALN